MLKKYSHIFEGFFIVTDILVVSAAWMISYWLRFSSGLLPVDKGVPVFADYLKLLIFAWAIWAFVYRRFGLYRPMRGVSRFRESWLVAKSNALSVLLLMAVTYLFWEKSVEFSRMVFLIFLVISTVFGIASRTAVRQGLMWMRRRGHNLRYALIVGAGELASNVAARMRLHPEYGIDLLGCLTGEDDPRVRGSRPLRLFANGRRYPVLCVNTPSSSYNSSGVKTSFNSPAYRAAKAAAVQSQMVAGHIPGQSSGQSIGQAVGMSGATKHRAKKAVLSMVGRAGVATAFKAEEHIEEAETDAMPVPILGTYADLTFLLREGGIDQVIIALPLNDHARLEEILSMIGDWALDIKIVPDLHRFIQLGSEIEEFDGMPVVSLASTPLFGFNKVLKRAFDFFMALFFIIITSPVTLLTAFSVWLTSRGPIYYKQERMGLDGKLFSIYKFRTMYVDAEKKGARFAVRNDPRVTPVGRLLRRFSIDELPQLLNVLRGQMSLVGPRPERPVFINEFRKRIPKYMLRHKVQAGMTGWAQVSGWRGNTSIEKRIEHDLFYIENWSLFFDVKILFLTIFTALFDRNAY